MATQKTQGKAGDAVLKELYDMLMYDIEPELVTGMLGDLPEIYEEETNEERAERAKRYAQAFEVFTERLGNILTLWKDELVSFQKKAFASFKEKSAREDASHLSDIERSIGEQ